MERILNIEEIRALLPHRPPMLLVDRILEITPGARVVGLKNVTINEPFFQGHFPEQAVMPGVLILEAMAQVAALMMLALPASQGKLAFMAGIEKAKFRRPVVPGDTLITEAKLIWIRNDIGRVELVGRVEGIPVAECEMSFAFKIPVQPSKTEVFAKLSGMRTDTNGSGHSLEGGGVDGTQRLGREVSGSAEAAGRRERERE